MTEARIKAEVALLARVYNLILNQAANQSL